MTNLPGGDPRSRQPTDLVVDVSEGFRPAGWMRDLGRRYEIQEEPSDRLTTVFLDTFDGRLFEHGFACSSAAGVVRLDTIKGAIRRAEVAVEPAPRFAVDFPEGALKEQLTGVTKQRALLTVLTMFTTRQSWRILNVDQKTVARIVLEKTEVCDEKQSARLGTSLVLKAVRGYEEVAREMEEWLAEQGLNHRGGSVYLQALDALHKTPKQNLVGSRPRLLAAMPAADAVRSLLGALYDIVRVNESGLLGDTDTEFLHDYRVAVRKARSLVGQTRGVFARGPTARFRKSLSWLGKSTNALRDLDVYLLHRSKYRELIGSPADEHIEPLFALLQRQRDEAFQTFVRIMNSQAYADRLSAWGHLVEDADHLGRGPKGSTPIEQVARRRIGKKCRMVLERGYEVTQRTEPGALHALRIECKQLRYLMELFEDLVPEAKVPIRRLKKLQDTLGNIQDLTIQEGRLRQYMAGPEIRSAGSNTMTATKQLITGVLEERAVEQQALLQLFARFNKSLGETHPPYALLLPWLRSSL